MVEILIIGGGATGLMTAYSLLRRGVRDVAVFDASYPAGGSTGRCASGIRASFTSKEHVVLMREAIKLWRSYSEGDLGRAGLKFHQSGYVWVSFSEEGVDTFRELVKLHNSLGVRTEVLGPDALKELVPPARTEGVAGIMVDREAGKACPFETVFALITVLRRHGIEVRYHTRVTGIAVRSGRVSGAFVEGRGLVEAEKVLVAAGPSSRDVLKPLGVEIPVKNMPRHALITEPYRPAFNPLVIEWDVPGVPYIVQTDEGAFYIAREIEEEPEEPLTSQRIDFMPKALKPLTRLFPWLRNVRVLRYWLGYYSVTPDHHPILGPVEGVEGLYIAAGFSGHGYMMSPVTGEVMAGWMLDGKPPIPEAGRLTLERFERGELIRERAIVG